MLLTLVQHMFDRSVYLRSIENSRTLAGSLSHDMELRDHDLSFQHYL